MDSSAENLSSAEIITSTCPNCAQPVHGVFCHNCGQKQVEYNRLIFTLINEVFGDVFTLNSRTFKTLGHLLVKPGFVSSEYSQGKRSRYLPALRLYLIASVVLALTISMGRFVNDGDEELHINFSPNASVEFDTEDRSIDGFEEEVRSLLEELKFDFLSEEADKRFDDYALARILTLYQLYQVDPGQLFENLINVLFQAMFVLVPFFAVVLKSFYLRSGRFYTEHLIFSIHNHTFIYLIFILGSFFELLELIPYLSFPIGILSAVVVLWIPIYLFMAQKRFYKQGTLVTIVKYVLLVVIYNVLLLSAFSITALGFILI